MKTIPVRYTFTVVRDVRIDDETAPPPPYDMEEWIEQQLMDEGIQLEMALTGRIDWRYERV